MLRINVLILLFSSKLVGTYPQGSSLTFLEQMEKSCLNEKPDEIWFLVGCCTTCRGGDSRTRNRSCKKISSKQFIWEFLVLYIVTFFPILLCTELNLKYVMGATQREHGGTKKKRTHPIKIKAIYMATWCALFVLGIYNRHIIIFIGYRHQ